MFSSLAQDLAVIQSRVGLPLGRAENSLPPESSTYNNRFGYRDGVWRRGQKVIKAATQSTQNSLKIENEARELRTSLYYHLKSCSNFLVYLWVKGFWILSWTLWYYAVKMSKFCYILLKSVDFVCFKKITRKLAQFVSNCKLCVMSGNTNISSHFSLIWDTGNCPTLTWFRLSELDALYTEHGSNFPWLFPLWNSSLIFMWPWLSQTLSYFRKIVGCIQNSIWSVQTGPSFKIEVVKWENHLSNAFSV